MPRLRPLAAWFIVGICLSFSSSDALGRPADTAVFQRLLGDQEYDRAVAYGLQALTQLQPAEKSNPPDEPLTAEWHALVARAYHNSNRAQAAIAHWKQSLEIAKRRPPGDQVLTDRMFGLADSLRDAERCAEALESYEAALRRREQELGADHPALASGLNAAGWCHHLMKQYGQAQPLYQRALAIYRTLHGTDHDTVRNVEANLALALYYDGKYGESENLYRDIYKARLQKLGAEALPTATAALDVGDCLYSLRRYVEAEELFRSGLRVYEKLLAADHLDLASPLEALGLCRFQAGDYPQACNFHDRALIIRCRLQADDHAAVLKVRQNLACALYHHGAFQEAERHYRNIHSVRAKQLGHQSLPAAAAAQDLANTLYALGQTAEAEKYYRLVLGAREKGLGTDHLDLAEALNGVGICRQQAGDYAQARKAYERALALNSRYLADDHEEILRVRRNLACTLSLQEAHQEAEEHHRAIYVARVKQQGTESLVAATAALDVGDCLYALGRYSDAEEFFRTGLTVRERLLGADHLDLSGPLNAMALCRQRAGNYPQAREFHERALRIRRRHLDDDHEDVLQTRQNLASTLYSLGMYSEAEKHYRDIHVVRVKQHGVQSLPAAAAALDLANTLYSQGGTEEAERQYKSVLRIREQLLENDHLDLAAVLESVGHCRQVVGDFESAQRIYERVLAIRRRRLATDHDEVLATEQNLALSWLNQGRLQDSAELLSKVRATILRVKGDKDRGLAVVCLNLAFASSWQGRQDEAEQLVIQALAIVEAIDGADHVNILEPLRILAGICIERGRYVEAEQLAQRAATLAERSLGATHPNVASIGLIQASIEMRQGCYAQAEQRARCALATFQAASDGQETTNVADAWIMLGAIYCRQGHYARSAELHRRALETFEKLHLTRHPSYALELNNIAEILYLDKRYDQAQELCAEGLALRTGIFGADSVPLVRSLLLAGNIQRELGHFGPAQELYGRAVRIQEDHLGPNHPELADCLYEWSVCCSRSKGHVEAQELIDRVIEIRESAGVSAGDRAKAFLLRAQLTWNHGDRLGALADLRQAAALAEAQRGQYSGGNLDRAQAFATLADVWEQMVVWQTELGDVEEVLSAIERSRARTLLDEFAFARSDLSSGPGIAGRTRRQHQSRELESRVRGIEQQLLQGDGLQDDTAGRSALKQSLEDARRQLRELLDSERSANPVYRKLLGFGNNSPRIRQLQKLVGAEGVMMVYLFGKEGGFVLTVRRGEAVASAIRVAPDDAMVMGIDSGALTAEKLKSCLSNDSDRGVMQLLANPRQALQADRQLSALWRTLIPESIRSSLLSRELTRIYVVPDATLAMLPLETLVVSPSGAPVEYLLDLNVTVSYTPSATVLSSLMLRPGSMEKRRDRPQRIVLTVGDPLAKTIPSGIQATYGQRGPLAPLPLSKVESTWVAENFRKGGQNVRQLLQDSASEAGVRSAIGGCSILHFACHGLADQTPGNMFGGLILSPGAGVGSNDDGLLTLAELCELNLSECELAILSACETNIGPQQTGEGLWAISRGFLIAGSRRVIASNWRIDDEASANLVCVFTERLAKAGASDATTCAEQLLAAKRWMRSQTEWRSPYYWGPLVLIGP